MESPDKEQFILYQPPDGGSKIEVTLSGEIVWLSIDQMTNCLIMPVLNQQKWLS